ncbi:hypothetical protein [Blastococcus sp. SYSU DS0619]
MAHVVPERRARRGVPWWALVPLSAAAWWVGGYLFWLLGGLRMLPVGARTALPLAPSMIGSLVLGALVGGVAAGLLSGAAARRAAGVLATSGGTALAVVLALGTTVRTLRTNAPDTFETEPAVVLGLSAVVVLVSGAGWALGAPAALGAAGAAPGLAVLAGAAPWWTSEGVIALVGIDGMVSGPGRLGPWLGAALLVTALVVVGARPVARLAWWPAVVLLAWFVAPALTAVSYLEQLLRPGSGLPATLPDALDAAWQVFGLASLPAGRDLLPWLVAIAVAAAVVVVRPRLRPTAGPRVEQPEELTAPKDVVDR